MADIANPDKYLVPRLGSVAFDIDESVQQKLHLRLPQGVIVAACTLDGGGVSGLLAGDAIHGLNRKPIETVEVLRRALRDCKRGDPLVVQIEREGRFPIRRLRPGVALRRRASVAIAP